MSINTFAVYGTLRDDCDELSQQQWTKKFIAGVSRTPRSALVKNMKLVYKRSMAEDWPYAMMTDSESKVDQSLGELADSDLGAGNRDQFVTVRLLEFAHNWTEKLIEADGVEQYDPDHPDDSPMGYKRRVVEAMVLDEAGQLTGEVVNAIMYYIDSFEHGTQYYDIPSGDWIKRDVGYHYPHPQQ